MNKKTLTVLSLVLGFGLLTSSVWADCKMHGEKCSGGDKQCKMSKGDCGKGNDCGDSAKCPISDKLMKKAHFFLSNSDEIGLSEEQIAKIKWMKLEAKKAAIRQGAEMQSFYLDLESKLNEPKVDVEGLNSMIDNASAGMAVAGKASVKALADLKAVLSEEQMAKAKQVWLKNN